MGLQPVFSSRLIPHDRWRRGALAFALAAFFTFILNLSFALWAGTQPSFDSVGIIYEGDGKTVKMWNTAFHVLVNIISTILLAGSNYCMQCLMAPTRTELDKAHSSRKWLDIGIPTIRNFWSIAPRRKLLWILLSISSFPLHLLFNSVVFASTSTNQYKLWAVNASLIHNGDVASMPTSLDTSKQLSYMSFDFPNTTIELLSASDCLNDYGKFYQSTRGSLLLVVENTNLFTTFGSATEGGGVSNPLDWMCEDESQKPCDEQIGDIKRNLDLWRPLGMKVQSCYSRPTKEHTKLFFCSTLSWIVTSLNLLKTVLMLFVAYGGMDAGSERPILTIGDAVASYLEDPDKHTADMCLKSKKDFAKKVWEPATRQFDPKRYRKFAAGSISRWVTCISLCLVALAVCVFLLVFGLEDLRKQSPHSSLAKYGPGMVYADATINIGEFGWDISSSLLFNVILANIPQVIMSLIYFNYNALYTCISLATEWDRFAGGDKKGLRVSATPQNAQRRTYFLQLPYRYSLPLTAFSGGLHWLISQSIFLVTVEVYEDDVPVTTKTNSCGYSPIAIMLVIAAAAVLVVFLVVSGFRRLRFGGIPVAGSCSAAISAACHPDPSEQDLATSMLAWGDISGEDETTRHCSFTSKEVERPREDCDYE